MHRERTLGTEKYLEACANYVSIFCSPRLDLRSRLVLASKVSFFLGFGSCGLVMETTKLWGIRGRCLPKIIS